MRLLIVLALLGGIARADGDPVALLPLDADKKLELYGQPVASELAIALSKNDIPVVVVQPNMSVPSNARLIVDGRITDQSGVTVIIRIRDPNNVVDPVSFMASAPAVTDIAKAASDAFDQVIPEIKKRLAEKPPEKDKPPTHPPTTTTPSILLAVHATVGTGEPLRAALVGEVTEWAKQHKREPHEGKITAEPDKLVASEKAELSVTFEVTRYAPVAGKVPMARGRVRVVIASAKEVLFDRVIVTDTVVGDAKSTPEALATRVAREVLLVLVPHIKKAVPTW